MFLAVAYKKRRGPGLRNAEYQYVDTVHETPLRSITPLKSNNSLSIVSTL